VRDKRNGAGKQEVHEGVRTGQEEDTLEGGRLYIVKVSQYTTDAWGGGTGKF